MKIVLLADYLLMIYDEVVYKKYRNYRNNLRTADCNRDIIDLHELINLTSE
jgi:hypothetical protein